MGRRSTSANEAEAVLDVVDRERDEIIKAVPLSGHPNIIAVTKVGGGFSSVLLKSRAPGIVRHGLRCRRQKGIPMKAPLHNVM